MYVLPPIVFLGSHKNKNCLNIVILHLFSLTLKKKRVGFKFYQSDKIILIIIQIVILFYFISIMRQTVQKIIETMIILTEKL